MTVFENHLQFAQKADTDDALKSYREAFLFPEHKGKKVLYFTGNSLGLQPASARDEVAKIMDSWARLAVDGHFCSDQPWWDLHERLSPSLAKLVGALSQEVAVMNTLTVNLHLLMVSFFRPQGKRKKILCEEKAFPSDQYLLQSQLRFHGLNPETDLIEVKKSPGQHSWQTSDFLEAIEKNHDELALVFLGGVNYYNGQVLDMPTITAFAQDKGITVGLDLAHAIGNVPLQLHNWQVDFAAWCSYKYLNSGPGSLAGIYVNQKYLNRKDIPRFEGWWGQEKSTRFKMQRQFTPMPNAEAWQLSNLPVLSLAPQIASLKLFDEVGLSALREKSLKLTAYLAYVLQHTPGFEHFAEIITPQGKGCQLSVLFHKNGKELFDFLTRHGVVPDWREPNVIRLAPVPFYNSFEDIYQFGQLLETAFQNTKA